jgi:endonuclease/exonuclease/phosphatase family metal-dependent hydrolase
MMSGSVRVATFNAENLDDKPEQRPGLATRIDVMRPQLVRLRADILCLQEIHGQEHSNQPRSLSALKDLIHNTPYENYHIEHTLTSGGEAYNERNLVVLSRFPISERKQIKHEYAPKPRYRKVTADPQEQNAEDITWERPIFYVTVDLSQNRRLHLINVHLKSKNPSNIEGQKIDRFTWRSTAGWAEGYFISSMKRVGQALEVRILIDKIFEAAERQGEEPLIAVCGDFNADFDSVPVKAIRGPVEDTGNPDLTKRVMVPCELTVPEPSRYSFLHLGKGEMLDRILVSRSMLTFYRGAEIHNEILPDESGAFRTDVKFPESDHAPVVAEFVLP